MILHFRIRFSTINNFTHKRVSPTAVMNRPVNFTSKIIDEE